MLFRSLEVEAAVEEVEVGWAGDVHRRAELAVWVGFEEFGVGNDVGGDGDGLGEVGEDDLSEPQVNSGTAR